MIHVLESDQPDDNDGFILILGPARLAERVL
jgi:hypothetical protein